MEYLEVYFRPTTHKKDAPEDKDPPEGKELPNLTRPYLSKVIPPNHHDHRDQLPAATLT